MKDDLEIPKFMFTNYNEKAIEEIRREPKNVNSNKKHGLDKKGIKVIATLSAALLTASIVQSAIHDHNYEEVSHGALGDYYNSEQVLVHTHDENDTFNTRYGEINEKVLYVADQLQVNEASTIEDIHKTIEDGEYRDYRETHEIKVNKELQGEKLDAQGNPMSEVDYYNDVAIPKAIEYVNQMDSVIEQDDKGLSN